MEPLVVLLERYGYGLLFGVGFLEFVGAPIVTITVSSGSPITASSFTVIVAVPVVAPAAIVIGLAVIV